MSMWARPGCWKCLQGQGSFALLLSNMGSTIALLLTRYRSQAPDAASFVYLTREVDSSLIDAWLESSMLVWIHLAPVCGTASRARDIQVLATDPKPLRSCEHPDGLPSLSGSDLRRVTLANKLYEFACALFEKATLRGILVTLENHRNSHFWSTSWFIALWRRVELHCCDFQACMLGGTRAKWTRLVANFNLN